MMGVRYSNGITMTYAARALTVDSRSMQVVLAEDLEDGVHINLAAPFLNGVAPCFIASKARAAEWSGYFLMELRFYEALDGVAMCDFVERPASRLNLEKIDIGVSCHELADLLESGWLLDFGTIIESSPPKQRLLYCALSAMAAMLWLQEEFAFDFRGMIESLPTSDPLMSAKGI